jgi:hypothetical protein
MKNHSVLFQDLNKMFSKLITLPNLRIIDYVIGHCGSAHDSTVFMDSHTFCDHQHLIGSGEWIWADSAYPIEAWCVTPYKKPAANIPENKTFNFWVSHVSLSVLGWMKTAQFCIRCESNLSTLLAI